MRAEAELEASVSRASQRQLVAASDKVSTLETELDKVCDAVCCSVLQCVAVCSRRVSILETELDKVCVAGKINQEKLIRKKIIRKN